LNSKVQATLNTSTGGTGCRKTSAKKPWSKCSRSRQCGYVGR